MISRCCKAPLMVASALYSNLEGDFYVCSQCGFDCDTLKISEPRKVDIMSNFDDAVNYVLSNEKELEENPNDPGGITKYGISLRFLKTFDSDKKRAYGIFDDEITADTIRNLTIDQAKSIYRGEFWNHAPFEKITNQNHCNYIFDMAVNMGISPAIKCVQRACWAVMREWQLLPDDGILGERTLAAIKKCGFLILPAIKAERGSYYRMIANLNPSEKEFLHGWYNRTYNKL